MVKLVIGINLKYFFEMIEKYTTGSHMTVNGKNYHRDLKIIDGEVKENWWRGEGHRLDTNDIQDILSARPEVFVIGTGYVGNMRVPGSVRQIIESQLGAPLDQAFARFDSEVLASASIAQVYAAQLPDGEDVVVKIVRPGIEARIRKDIELLIQFAGSVPNRFPRFKDTAGLPVPADIEFGFYRGKLVLFQIRPFLESSRARQSLYLNGLDQHLLDKQNIAVDLDGIPLEENE